MNRATPELTDMRHIKLCYSKDRYCGHPRQSGIFNYGNGEIAVLHSHAPSRYQVRDDISHSFTTGYPSRAKILLQRSLDGGETWPREHDVVVYDESRPLEEKRAALARADLFEVNYWNTERTVDEERVRAGVPEMSRQHIDLTSPDAAVYFTRTATGPPNEDGEPSLECFAFRSADRGRTWEDIPTRVIPPPGFGGVFRDAHPLVKFPDGSLMGAMSVGGVGEGALRSTIPGGVAVYGSDDNGLSWNYLALAAVDPTGMGSPTYPGLLLLPSGRLQCYMLNIGGIRHAIQLAYSDDGGYSWSQPQPIVAWGRSPWGLGSGRAAVRGNYYRSPWPLLLDDGRILVLFGRRKTPFGIGVIASDDEGASWSPELVIRGDASGTDLSYPVATQLDDGRIFTAYYFMEDDGNKFGGTRHIAGSSFRLA